VTLVIASTRRPAIPSPHAFAAALHLAALVRASGPA
jgi:hypothetical protein